MAKAKVGNVVDFRSNPRTKRLHKYIAFGSSRTLCGKEIKGVRNGYGGSVKWSVVTCPLCLRNKDRVVVSRKKATKKVTKRYREATPRLLKLKSAKVDTRQQEPDLSQVPSPDRPISEASYTPIQESIDGALKTAGILTSVVLAGNPIDGFTVIGPFRSMVDGVEWAYDNCDVEYVVAECNSPKDYE